MPITDGKRQPSGEMLSPSEVARILGVHTETVRRYIRQGHLPAQHLGPRTLRVKRSDLENLAKAYKPANTDTDTDSDPDRDAVTVTLRGPIGKRLHDQALQAGVTAEEMTSQLLTDFEKTVTDIENGYADLDAGRVMDFEQYVGARHERRARNAAEQR